MNSLKPINPNLDNDNIEFTFYGDLLGVSNLYTIDKDIAYDKLNEFYDITWKTFNALSKRLRKPNLSIFLFSDSIFITGNKIQTTIHYLGYLYYKLYLRQIFLRGAMVLGKLDFDPRIELENIRKELPVGDVLFRAVTLEHDVKGARFLIENKLAKKITPSNWWTDELYIENIQNPNLGLDDFRRRIILHREWRSYEYLWPWPTPGLFNNELRFTEFMDLAFVPKQFLSKTSKRMPKSVACHYQETKELFDNAECRARVTKSALKE
ncbi:MAG: hypothetical protein A2V66_08020 [Ignavibacteria bacterium RBG_13_36_8]|nr:MAG: hypothetical protein A2V66_08020 [Ignavibacteria bacterium RBG_13_36_8]